MKYYKDGFNHIWKVKANIIYAWCDTDGWYEFVSPADRVMEFELSNNNILDEITEEEAFLEVL